MSVDYHDWLMELTCDNCGEDHSVNGDTWREALDCAKEDGWQVSKNEVSDEWVHFCSKECKKEYGL